jgi:hypothetical protein
MGCLLLEEELDTFHSREGVWKGVGALGFPKQLVEEAVDLEVVRRRRVLEEDEAKVHKLGKHGISIEVLFLVMQLQLMNFLS